MRILKETEQLPDVKHRVLHPGKVLRFADQLSQALGAFEEGGIVHGDLKPSNIIVTLSGDIRIIDFGVAGKHGHPRDYLAGSYDYMSPDQWSYIKEHLQPGTPAKDYLLNHADDLHAARTLLEDALLAGIGFTRENLPEKYKIDFEKDSGIETPSPIYQLQTSVWNIYRDLAQRHGLVQPPTQERILKMLSTALHFRHYKGVSQFGEVLEQLKKADAAGSTDGFFEYFGKEVLGQVSPTIAANFIFSAPETITAWGQNKLGLSATQKSRILIAGQIFYGGKFPRPYGFEQFLARQYAQPFPGAISTAVDNSQ